MDCKNCSRYNSCSRDCSSCYNIRKGYMQKCYKNNNHPMQTSDNDPVFSFSGSDLHNNHQSLDNTVHPASLPVHILPVGGWENSIHHPVFDRFCMRRCNC